MIWQNDSVSLDKITLINIILLQSFNLHYVVNIECSNRSKSEKMKKYFGICVKELSAYRKIEVIDSMCKCQSEVQKGR